MQNFRVVFINFSCMYPDLQKYILLYNGIRYNTDVWVMQKERNPGDKIIP